ncbi:MAG: MG2 domain-containing protein, partial [Anaerolineae bacterium]
FQPDEPLRPGARYEITLQSGVQDALGFRLAEPVISEFGTASMTGLPLPVPGSKNVALDSIIRVPFTRPMDKASVEEGLVLSPTLAGEMAWDKDTLVFTPRGGLAPETPYQIGLTADVRDASGAPLGQPSLWAFVTEPFLLDTELPSDAVVMELQQPIEFTFALPMDRGSVQSALMISPTTPGDLSWSDDARAVSYQPDPGWLSGVDYQVTLSGSARTADGYQTLGEDLVWTFSTGVAEVQFGQGPNVQVVHADAERAIQVIARGADVADFHLYPITPTQFLDAYSSGFRGIGPWEPQILDTVGLTPTVQWREALMPLEAWDYGDDWRAAEVHLPEGVLPGLYILSAEPASEVQGQLLVALTRHALILKRALAGSGSDTQAQIVAWDSEMDGGAPVISSTVRLYDREGTFLAEGVTNADGLLVLDVPGDPAPLMALSDRDGDVTVCGLSNEWSEGGWWWIEPPRRPLYSTYSYTDRPIYRPGQTVYFKDLVRADEDVSYTLPAPDLPVTVRLRDARDNIAASQVLTPTQFGTVYGEFHLADEPMLGTWHLETEVDSTVTRQPLKVEEYRKPEYEVTVQTPQKVYVVGEAVSVTVQAAYYFDQPVAGANAVLTVYPTYPEAFYDGEEGPQFGYPLLVENGRTDEQGVWTVMVPTEGVFSYRDRSRRAALALEMTITDDTGQSVSSYQTVVVQRTSQALTLLLERRGYEPDEEIAFSAQVHDRDGEPVVGAELTAQILGWDDQEVARATASTGASGLADFGIRLAEQGWYQIRVRGIDDGGREVEAEEWLWVYDPSGQAPWYPGQQAEETSLSVSADQATYAVGDEARLAVYTRVPGPALLAFERGGTRHVELIELVSGTNLITVPIRANYAPNIHVSVNQFGPPAGEQWPEQSRPEAKLHRASTQLLVPMTDRRLTVSLTADQAVHGAGDEATFRVQVTDHQGEPVVAEVSLAVVDEAIYALAEDMSKDPFEVFYAPRPNMVRTFDSLRPSRWLYPEGPGLGGGGEEAAGAPR